MTKDYKLCKTCKKLKKKLLILEYINIHHNYEF